MSWVPELQEHAELEYRVAVLEGLVSWLLSNAYLNRPLDFAEVNKIYKEAEATVRRRFPQVEIDYEPPSLELGKEGYLGKS